MSCVVLVNEIQKSHQIIFVVESSSLCVELILFILMMSNTTSGIELPIKIGTAEVTESSCYVSPLWAVLNSPYTDVLKLRKIFGLMPQTYGTMNEPIDRFYEQPSQNSIK